jgi:hypothetical protein
MDPADLARLALDLHVQVENARLMLAHAQGAWRQNAHLPDSTRCYLFAAKGRLEVVLDAALKAKHSLQPLVDSMFPEGLPAGIHDAA